MSVRLRHRSLSWGGPLARVGGVALAAAVGLVLIHLSLLDGILVLGLTILGVATLLEPLVGLGAALFLGPLRAYLSAEVPQVPAQLGQVFLVLAVGAWLARGLRRRDLRFPHVRLLLPLTVFAGAALLSLWQPVELATYGLPEFAKWLQILIVFVLVTEALTLRKLNGLLIALLAGGLFEALVGIWQFGLRGDGPDHFAITVLGDGFYRAYGTFEQPNPFAGYLGLILSLGVGVVIGLAGEVSQGRRPVEGGAHAPRTGRLWALLVTCVLVCVVLGAALGMSWSRGAWMGFGAAVLVMALALPKKAGWGLALIGALLLGGLGLAMTGLLPAPMTARLTGFADYLRFEDVRGVGINDANYSVIERLAHWQAALEMWRSHFWTGVGIGGYEPAYAGFALINWPIALGHAHNYYLTIAAETGIIGLVAYLVLWVAVFWWTWRASRRTQGLLRGVTIGLLGAWTHLSVHHMLDSLYVNNVHLHIAVLLGILAFIVGRVEGNVNSL